MFIQINLIFSGDVHVYIFPFSYERFEVLGVFASTMLAQLGSLFILKERYIHIEWYSLFSYIYFCSEYSKDVGNSK